MTVGTRNKSVGGVQGGAPVFPFNEEVVVPSDATVFEEPTSITAYAAGDVAYEPWGKNGTVVRTVTAAMLPWTPQVMVRRVLAAGTTVAAGQIFGVW